MEPPVERCSQGLVAMEAGVLLAPRIEALLQRRRVLPEVCEVPARGTGVEAISGELLDEDQRCQLRDLLHRCVEVGDGDVKDFTALGDVVNTAARLQSSATAGQIVLSERLFDRLATRPPDATPTALDLKGKHAAEPARVIDLSARQP
jgi:hypothetical protein